MTEEQSFRPTRRADVFGEVQTVDASETDIPVAVDFDTAAVEQDLPLGEGIDWDMVTLEARENVGYARFTLYQDNGSGFKPKLRLGVAGGQTLPLGPEDIRYLIDAKTANTKWKWTVQTFGTPGEVSLSAQPRIGSV